MCRLCLPETVQDTFADTPPDLRLPAVETTLFWPKEAVIARDGQNWEVLAQEPLPEWALLRVLKTLWASGYAFDRAHAIYRLHLPRQFLHAREVARRRNVARRNRQDQFRLGRKLLLNLLRLTELWIAGGEEKILVHHRPQVDEPGHQGEQDRGDDQHHPVRGRPERTTTHWREVSAIFGPEKAGALLLTFYMKSDSFSYRFSI